MTELEWQKCADSQIMLRYLRERTSARKLRLFCCACVRMVLHWIDEERVHNSLVLMERVIEGEAEEEELDRDWEAAWGGAVSTAGQLHVSRAIGPRRPEVAAALVRAAAVASSAFAAAQRLQCHLLRDVIGNPFRPVAIPPDCLAWNDGTVKKLARMIYDERAFGRLALLGDALEEAGCTESVVLAHCRSGGEHVRGCWLIDLLLDKE